MGLKHTQIRSVSDPKPEPDPEGSETFGRIRSGTELNVSDPDPKLDPKKICKGTLFSGRHKVVSYDYTNISHLQVVVCSVMDPKLTSGWIRIRNQTRNFCFTTLQIRMQPKYSKEWK
jgi:hypothetical protein